MNANANSPIIAPSTTDRRRSEASRRRRVLDAIAFVAVWVTAGYLLPIDANADLLLGIPMTVGFHVPVRRRPLRELFVAGTTRLHLGARGLAVGAALSRPGGRLRTSQDPTDGTHRYDVILRGKIVVTVRDPTTDSAGGCARPDLPLVRGPRSVDALDRRKCEHVVDAAAAASLIEMTTERGGLQSCHTSSASTTSASRLQTSTS